MSDENGLASSNGNDAGLLVLAVDGSVVSSQKEVLLALDVQAAGLERRGVIEALGQLQHLSGRHGEAGGGAPDGVTGPGKDGGLVDITRSHQVINISCVSGVCARGERPQRVGNRPLGTSVTLSLLTLPRHV